MINFLLRKIIRGREGEDSAPEIGWPQYHCPGGIQDGQVTEMQTSTVKKKKKKKRRNRLDRL